MTRLPRKLRDLKRAQGNAFASYAKWANKNPGASETEVKKRYAKVNKAQRKHSRAYRAFLDKQ